MAWIYLAVAGFLEIIWAFAMKQSDGFTRMIPTLITLIGMIGSLGFLALAMRALPLGTAYTIWTGIGAVGAFLVGILFLGEQINVIRVAAATMIVAGLRHHAAGRRLAAIMKTTILFIALIGLLGVTGWWIMDVNSTIGVLDMPVAGWMALIFGVVISLVVGVGLMLLVFYSNRKGHDEPPTMIP